MNSNLKKLGQYIEQIDIRNTSGALDENDLYGVSVNKEFITTHANLVGVKFNNYKVVEEGQFTYIPDTSRRGDKIAIALNHFGKSIIVSNVYTVFRIYKNDELLNDYLMLLFQNPEFDRYARYNSWGSAREVFSWEELCNTEFHIPSLDEQKKIVRQYRTIVNRVISLRKESAELERFGNLYLASISIDDRDGSKDTEKYYIKDFCPIITGKKDANEATGVGDIPFFTCSTDNLWTNEHSFDSNSVLVAGNGDFNVKHYKGKFEAYQRTYVLTPNEEKYVCLLYFVIKSKIQELTKNSRGSVISYITKDVLENLSFQLKGGMSDTYLVMFSSIINMIDLNNKEILALIKLKNLLLTNSL